MLTPTRNGNLQSTAATKTAVIVVDLQNDFCAPKGALGRTGMSTEPLREVIPRINGLTRHCRKRGATRIFLQSVYTDRKGRFRSTAMARQAQARWDGRGSEIPFLREGDWGTELHAAVEFESGDIVVRKFSYDGFFRSKLQSTLRSANVERLIVTGITTDICVLFTAQEAYQRGYDVIVPESCVAAYDAGRHAAALKVLDHAIGRVANADAVIEAMR